MESYFARELLLEKSLIFSKLFSKLIATSMSK